MTFAAGTVYGRLSSRSTAKKLIREGITVIGNIDYYRSRPSRRALLLGAMLACCLSTGCARWSSDHDAQDASAMLLPRPAQSLDRVVVETVLVRFSNQQVQELLSIWDQVDESILDLPLRERLDRNGLRAGLLVGELPSLVRQKLESEASQLGTLEAADLAADIDEKMRRLQCRAGRRKELLVRPTLNQPLTVISTDGQEVRGDTFERPTVLFDLRAVPYGNKQVAIELTPEIQHGDFQQAFVASEFGVRPETRRPRKAWRALTVACQLSPGQVFVVAATQPAKALGTAFFQTETAEQSREHVVLLLRVGESGLDELFAPEKAAQIQSLIER